MAVLEQDIFHFINTMSDSSAKFINYPEPRKGPTITYQNETPSNPVLRGFAIAPLALIIRSSSWLQSIFWKLNKFDKLKELPDLELYKPCYDPTVVPVHPSTGDALTLSELPRPKVRQDGSMYYSSSDYHEMYKSKQITPLQVAEYLVSIISRPNKDQAPDRYTAAFISTKAELVLAAARASTQRYAQGKPLSALDGVPVAVKDEIELKGYRKTEGCSIDFTSPRDETGWCVRKWEEAGAVVIGKTNMHEMGLDTNGFNSTWGTPLNPHNEGYYTGGSSSGSACTVAQGICPITLGADGGGSIRVPSSFCGVYGLKPSHGRISGAPTQDLAGSVGVYGPIASNVDDLTLAYRLMAQPDRVNRTSGPNSFPNPLSSTVMTNIPAPKTIGVDRAWIARSDPFVQQLFNQALVHYSKSTNYSIIDITIPYLPENQKAHALTILSEVRAGLSSSQIKSLNYHSQVLLSTLGSQASVHDFISAQRLRAMMMQHLAWLWKEYPGLLIVTPTTPGAGWKIGDPADVAFRGYGASDSNMSLRSMEYVYVANWTGAPAVTVPMGYTEENVPVGLMAMGEWGSEEQLLAWAGESDGLLGGHGIRRPKAEGCWVDVLERVKNGA